MPRICEVNFDDNGDSVTEQNEPLGHSMQIEANLVTGLPSNGMNYNVAT